MKNQFSRYLGIDYSGAETPKSRLARLRVFSATTSSEPVEVDTAAGDGSSAKVMRWNWTREELAHWLLEQLAAPEPAIVGIDHGFSFPETYLKRYGIGTWDEFLDDFCRHWPTHEDVYVDDIREQKPPRTGRINEFRLSERRAPGTQSVFKLDGQGTVGKSTHSGIPWLRFLRRHPELAGRLHFWPFDGFDVPAGRSVIAEVWPTLFRRQYEPLRVSWTQDQHDAYAVAKWLQDTDACGGLGMYFSPTISEINRPIVLREGWILGVR